MIWSYYATIFGKIEVHEVCSLDPLQFPGRRCVCALLSPVLRLLHFQNRKSFQVLRTDVGDSPEFESVTFPVQNVIAILSEAFRGSVPGSFQRPDKQVNNM